MKLGIIYCAHQTEDYVAPSLESWVRARAARPDGDEYVICAVSVPFKGFPDDGARDLTVSHLTDYLHAGEIDHIITSDVPMAETEARGAALTYLIERGVETTVMVDSDEFWRLGEIARTVTYVKSNPLIPWFKVCLRNAVFDSKTYLIEPFTPPRIHRMKAGTFRATHFVGDNDISYGGYPQEALAHITIPQSVAWVRHMSWLNDARSCAKQAYQRARWGLCSFRWDDEKGLAFDEAYYAARGQPLPETTRDPERV